MRFSGERQVGAPAVQVWSALHDREVLHSIIPGCEGMAPRADGTFAATLRARVGPVTDTYRGTFSIEDLRPGSALRVLVGASGRCGRLEVDLRVTLTEDRRSRTSALRYDADATVGGLVARLGGTTLTLAGSHFTTCFFRDLDRALRHGTAVQPAPRRARTPAPA
jgi:hypothetical protein